MHKFSLDGNADTAKPVKLEGYRYTSVKLVVVNIAARLST